MLYYVHKLAAYLVSLKFGADQVVYNEFLELFY